MLDEFGILNIENIMFSFDVSIACLILICVFISKVNIVVEKDKTFKTML